MKYTPKTIALVGSMLFVGVLLTRRCEAMTVYDETVDGPLSDDHTQPTLVATEVGSNLIRGSLNENGSKLSDFWTISVGPGERLKQIVFTDFGPVAERSFFGVEFGEQISNIFTGEGLAGGDHIGAEPGTTVGSDVLDDLAAGTPTSAIGLGFATPLAEGTYSFWFQEGSEVTTKFDYEFDYQIGLAGDFNDDAVSAGQDFLRWQTDGLSLTELTDWMQYYGGQSLSASYSVPEPAALAQMFAFLVIPCLGVFRINAY